jgi:hypothetical protein
MYFWYVVAVFLAVVEIFFLFLFVDLALFLAPKIQRGYRKHNKYFWSVLAIIILAIAIQIFKDKVFYQYLNHEKTEGGLFVALKYSLNILLGFLEFVLCYIFYRKLVDKINEVRSGRSENGGS